MTFAVFLLFLLFGIIVFHNYSSNWIIRLLDVSIAIFLYYNIVVLTTNNNDWPFYEHDYDSLLVDIDLGWYITELLSQKIGLSYLEFYKVVQTFIGLTFLYAIYYFHRKDYTLITIFVLLFLMPNSSILIRNYYAYAIFILSLIAFCKGKKTLSIFFAIASILCHFGLLLIVPIYLFQKIFVNYHYNLNRLIKKCLIAAIIIAIAQTLIISTFMLIGMGSFAHYQDQIASVPATIFMLLQYAGLYIVGMLQSKTIYQYNDSLPRKEIIILSISFYALLFLGLTRIMIIFYRLYEPLLLLLLISILHNKKYIIYQNKRYKIAPHTFSKKAYKSYKLASSLSSLGVILIIIVFMALHKYYLLGFKTGESEWLSYYRDIIISNPDSILFYLLRIN